MEQAAITFKAKPISVLDCETGAIAYRLIRIPELTRKHCDMEAMRKHPRFGGLANSDLFPNVLKQIRRNILGSPYREELRLDQLPPNVTVDESGFLATVTITI